MGAQSGRHDPEASMNAEETQTSPFVIPVVLFIFKRQDTLPRILGVLRQVRPTRVYVIADGARIAEEVPAVEECRQVVERGITWNCQIIKRYAVSNVGVYGNIGCGARWVLSREPSAIFLEDDNLPELTFFHYCEEMLKRYATDERVLWICGTNYLGKSAPKDGSSYMFTRHLLPCGWASWGEKFCQHYDGELRALSVPGWRDRFARTFENRGLYRQQRYLVERTKWILNTNKAAASWDYQMAASIRMTGMYGIAPACNQIQNIGVDINSTHGGNSFRYEMTRRLCGMDSFALPVPLRHPPVVSVDANFEERIGKIILYPWYLRSALLVGRILKMLFGISKYASLTSVLKDRIRKLLQSSTCRRAFTDESRIA